MYDNKLQSFFNKINNNIKKINGKIVGEEAEFIERKLAKDDRGAWVNHLVEQYLKKEELDESPENFEITMEDITDEIFQREIDKIFKE